MNKRKKKILFIGASSFIGSAIVNSLNEDEYYPILLSRDMDQCRLQITFNGDYKVIHGSLLEINNQIQIFRNDHIDFIVHLSSSIVPSSRIEEYERECNEIVEPTINLIDEPLISSSKFIYFSSGGMIYGNPRQTVNEKFPPDPKNFYAKAKATIEEKLITNKSGLDYVILRPSNVYGRQEKVKHNQGFIENSIIRILKDEPIEIWGNPNQSRDYIFIDDLCSLFNELLNKKCSDRIFNIALGKSYTTSEIIKILEKLLNKEALINYLPDNKQDVDGIHFDVSLLEQTFDHKLLDLDQGIASFLRKNNSIQS
jgi:UDP-glucose 4-epimerase